MEAIDQQWPRSVSAFIDVSALSQPDTLLCSMSSCPALTAHVPSEGVHVFLIYCVRRQCCIICVLRKDINPSSHCGKWLFFSPSQVKCTLPEK